MWPNEPGRVLSVASDRTIQNSALIAMTTTRIAAASSTASISRGRLRGTSRRVPDENALRYRRALMLLPVLPLRVRQHPPRPKPRRALASGKALCGASGSREPSAPNAAGHSNPGAGELVPRGSASDS